MQYELWLVLRDYNETCTESQRLLELEIVQRFNRQFVLFDGNGEEAFNLRKTVWSFSEVNLCLLSDLPYAFVFYNSYPRDNMYSLQYKLNGVEQQGSIRSDVVLDTINAISIVSLPAGAEPESPMNLSSVYIPAPAAAELDRHCECEYPSSEALMEMKVSNGTAWFALFDATSQGLILDGSQRYCLPTGRHYSILTGFSLSSADLLEISLNGVVVNRVNGPFPNDVGIFPRIVSTIITPRMLEVALASAQTKAPTGSPVLNLCFPGDATVVVEDKGEVSMKALCLGDKVRVANNEYEPIYSFGHKNKDMFAEFLQIITANVAEGHSSAVRDQLPLELSKDHMIFIRGKNQECCGRAVPASMIRKDDHLIAATGELVVVKGIRTVVRKGVYAPFTKSGTIVVDGILASTYVAIQGTPEYLFINKIGISYQWLAHAFESFRHRVMDMSGEETYTNDGVSLWVDGPHEFMTWILKQNRVVAIGIMLPLTVCFLSISLIEKVLFVDPAPFFATTLIGCTTAAFLVFLVIGKGGTWKKKFKSGLAK